MAFWTINDQQNSSRPYFPLVAFVATITTLLVVLGLYTSRNLTVSRERLEASLKQQGFILSRAIEAGNRAAVRMQSQSNHLQVLVEENAITEKVLYISVIGADGTILAHSDPAKVGYSSDIDDKIFNITPFHLITRTLHKNAEDEVFEIITRVPPVPLNESQKRSLELARVLGVDDPNEKFRNVAVIRIGMSLAELQEIHGSDLRNAILMLIFLSLAGSATLFFIFFRQNYTATNRAYNTMKSHMQHVVNSMTNGLISLDTEGRITTMNRQAFRIFDISLAEPIKGRTLLDLANFHGFNVAKFLGSNHAGFEQDITCTTKAGSNRSLSMAASMLTDDDSQQLGSVLIVRDLSAVKALHERVERAERLASLGKLAAGVAHEIRNPLGALKGFLQYFHHRLPLNDQEKTYFTVMMSEVDRLNSVVTNLLEFSNPKKPELEYTDVIKLMQHVLSLVESDLLSKQIAVKTHFNKNLPIAFLDRDQITQVFLNILMNALQALESDGKITINITFQKETQKIEITVSDNGAGISDTNRSRIFDPFFTTKKQGAGLGLAIAHTIIENHQGEILVESSGGQGSTFRILLPVQKNC